MPSRRDQIQSQQFATQRAVTALVAGEADPAEPPLRRLAGAGFGSVMIAILALAAVGIFGLVTGRSSAGWRDGGSVVLESESGAAFVLIDGVLRPTANFVSAVLLNGSAGTVRVPRADLESMPRGPMVGIPNAPDSLPPSSHLLAGAWSICTSYTQTASGDAGSTTAMFVGATMSGGRALTDSEGLLVRLPDGDTLYLVWHGYRYRIDSSAVVLEALAWRQAPQLTIGSSWLNALPAGRSIAPLRQEERGRPFPGLADLPDAKVGQVLVVETAGERQHYLVGQERLRPITAVEASIVLADPATRAAYDGGVPTARQLSASAANAAPRDAATAPSAERPPSQPPRIVGLSRSDATMCAGFNSTEAVPAVRIDGDSLLNQGLPTEKRTQRGVSLVDRVVVAPGHGAIVAAEPAPGAESGTLFLVTDLGIRYPLASLEVLRMLGYGDITPVRLPAGLVARLPEGPELDPAVAGRPVAVIDASS